MSWTAKITGDMTLSVLDDRGFKVLGVDMLRMNTMQAGDGGETLARTLNDLGLLAQAAGAENPNQSALADPSAGLSPRPWEIDFQESKRRVLVRDAKHRTVGERTFPKSITPEMLTSIVRTMTRAVETVNGIHLGEDHASVS
jgi:hypothetical protein